MGMHVFVSCTTNDLGPFRDALCDRPAEWWGDHGGLPEFSSMLDAKAESIRPVDWSIREAARADLLVVLLGQHHGDMARTPDPTACGIDVARLRKVAARISSWREADRPDEFSYTQWEILAGIAAGVPLLLFSPDRRSNDEDLQACQQSTEPAALRNRQARFAAWIRSEYSEDYFGSRHDLINKVRKAIRRHQHKRRFSYGIAFVVVMLLMVAGAAYGIHTWHVAAMRADEMREKTLARQYAVALGGALAMSGHSSAGAGRPILEKALLELGMPPNQVGELASEYNELDKALQDDLLALDEAQARKARFAEKVLTRLDVMRPALTAYVDFGRDATHLLLLLRFWDASTDGAARRHAAQETLRRFRDACNRLELDEATRSPATSLTTQDLEDPRQRAAASDAVLRCLGVYELEINGMGLDTETKPW